MACNLMLPVDDLRSGWTDTLVSQLPGATSHISAYISTVFFETLRWLPLFLDSHVLAISGVTMRISTRGAWCPHHLQRDTPDDYTVLFRSHLIAVRLFQVKIN